MKQLFGGAMSSLSEQWLQAFLATLADLCFLADMVKLLQPKHILP